MLLLLLALVLVWLWSVRWGLLPGVGLGRLLACDSNSCYSWRWLYLVVLLLMSWRLVFRSACATSVTTAAAPSSGSSAHPLCCFLRRGGMLSFLHRLLQREPVVAIVITVFQIQLYHGVSRRRMGSTRGQR